MLKVQTDEGDFWVGVHESVGLVIYDPVCQQGESDIWCRFFVVEKSRYGEFLKDDARRSLSDNEPIRHLRDHDPDKLNLAISSWAKIRERLLRIKGRKSHCHGCWRELDGYSYPICLKCFWIKCNCGNCGCTRDAVSNNGPGRDEYDDT